MFIFLIVCAICAGVIGIFGLSQATFGVGFIAFSCLISILARIVQAASHQEQLLSALKKLERDDNKKQED
jgi:hypothetical protein